MKKERTEYEPDGMRWERHEAEVQAGKKCSFTVVVRPVRRHPSKAHGYHLPSEEVCCCFA